MITKAPEIKRKELKQDKLSHKEIKSAVLKAIYRMGGEKDNSDFIANDIVSNCMYLKEKEIISALRMGSLGRWGVTQKKELSSQQVFYWLQEYLKEFTKPEGISVGQGISINVSDVL